PHPPRLYTPTPLPHTYLHAYLPPHSHILFLYHAHPPPHLHSFPTRRSSDLFAATTRRAKLGPGRVSRNSRPISIFPRSRPRGHRSEEHTSELQSRGHLVCRLLLEKKKKTLPSRARQIRYNADRRTDDCEQ